MKLTPEEMEEVIAKYGQLDSYEEQQEYLKSICERHNVSMRSIVASLAKRGVYKSKPKPNKKPSTKVVEVRGVGTISISKDRIISELEDRLQIPPGDLFSLRAATKEALVALIGGIKAVEDGLVQPEMETFYDSFEDKVNAY